jgi:ADP-dependent NAD(P)H-hydrate dehydratase / NAD(P)H-hydrate epimerase
MAKENMLHPAALLTAAESQAADRATIDAGTPMEKAGRAVAALIGEHYAPCSCLVICGPGNNGGDGKIVATLLKDRGWPVEYVAINDFKPEQLKDKKLIVDALFGTGLNKNIEGAAAKVVDAINHCGAPVVAIDIASGVNASDGTVMGYAVRATHTVTFMRPKLGQVLLPGKAYTGTLHVFDIGIGGDIISPTHFLNIPALWKMKFPLTDFDSHKYTRGHVVIVGGESRSTGAARLAAISALRAGAGLVSVACSPESLPIYAASLTAVMTKPVKNMSELATLLEDTRVTAALIGPGADVNEKTRERVLHILSLKKSCVLDADALTVFKNDVKTLFAAIQGPVVLTPHEGEFARLFSPEGNKTERTHEAAKLSGAVVVCKGNDTVIAAPDGRIAVNANAPAALATAGSGDVLAGIIAGLLALGMPAFEAACAGVWMQGRAAAECGPGLISEDLPTALPAAIKELYDFAE